MMQSLSASCPGKRILGQAQKKRMRTGEKEGAAIWWVTLVFAKNTEAPVMLRWVARPVLIKTPRMHLCATESVRLVS